MRLPSERTMISETLFDWSGEIDRVEKAKLRFIHDYNKYARDGVKIHPDGTNRLKAFDRLIQIMKGRFQRILKTLKEY